MRRSDIPKMIPLDEVKRRLSSGKIDPITHKPIPVSAGLSIRGGVMDVMPALLFR